MADIQPLAAIRYPQTEQTTFISPPYDVLSAVDKQHLLARNPHNVAAIDLPHVPPKNAGPVEVYQQAAKTMENWITQGVLRRDDTPALYPYEQTYTYDGTTYHRRGLFCRVRLEEFGLQGAIHPHEQTFSGPKEDRLLLMRATQANLSPVFGLYDDTANTVTGKLFAAVANQAPVAQAQLPSQDGKSQVISELWSVRDPGVIASVRHELREKHLYIADGHHRYGTCLNYRAEITARHGAALPPDHPAHFALFVLIAMQDPGLIVLPTHRVAGNLAGFTMASFLQAAAGKLQRVADEISGVDIDKLEKRLAEYGAHAIGIYDPKIDRVVVVRPVNHDPLATIGEDPALVGKSEPWRQLDVAILQHLVFDRVVAPAFAGGRTMQWAFPHVAHEVREMCRSGQYQAGFVLQPTPLESVRQLCNANELMPQKSTFFYPKLATGLVINSVAG
ncbi:MAG: DUF1015 domain-containing protein [Phycisphaerae bacterium]